MMNGFAVFIISHKRADNVITAKTLESQGYTGDWFVVVSDDDPQMEDYKKIYKNRVLVFNKDEVEKTFDIMDNLSDQKVSVYARNKCFDFAEELGYEYFLELDDDYVEFELREQQGDKLLTHRIANLDSAFEAMVSFLDDTKSDSVAFAQGGDMIGGVNGATWKAKLKRKAMNSFFCKTSRKFQFMGRLNEDVNAYTYLGSIGHLFLTMALIDVRQVPTQKGSGGLSESYLERGTYQKSFYSVMLCPSSVKISMMGEQHRRIHHEIDWDTAVPKIVSDRFKVM